MTASQPTLFTREDTIFGICEGIGQDFGFNAQYLRVALAGMVFWNPPAAVAAYATLGVAVLLSRKLFPTPTVAVAAAGAPAVHKGENDAAQPEMALAA